MAKFCQACGASLSNEFALFCDKCGAKLPSSQPETVVTTTNKKESTLNSAIKYGAICCGALLVCAVISAFIFGIGGNVPSSSPTSDVKNIGNPTVKSTVISTPAQSSIPTEIELAIGQMASNPERQVTVYSAQKTASYYWGGSTSTSYTEKAKSGKTYVLVDAEIKNIGTDSMYAGQGSFSISDSEGNKYDPAYYYGDDGIGLLKELYKNQKVRGKLVIEVPQSANQLKLYYDFGHLFSGTKLASWAIN